MQHIIPVIDSTVSVYTSTITAWLHMKPSNPINIPATKPVIRQMPLSTRCSMFFSSAMPSIIMLLPRETIRAIKPHERAGHCRGDGHAIGNVANRQQYVKSHE